MLTTDPNSGKTCENCFLGFAGGSCSRRNKTNNAINAICEEHKTENQLKIIKLRKVL